jgi:hypothetical protein
MQKTYLLLPVLFLLFAACESSPPPAYHSGLQVLYRYDSSRLFDTTAPKTPRYYRPVKIDLFYPAAAGGPTLSFGDIFDGYEKRFDFNTPVDSCKKTSLAIAGMFAEYLHMDTAARLLTYPTGIAQNAKPAEGKFPLIIYAAGMNGSSWENPLLFEQLNRQGYVVAAISSVGKYPGYMSAATDVEEQVMDILFTKKLLGGSLPFVDAENTGLLSWSMGGSAITKAAMLAPDVKCLLSFDGTETHYYGYDTAWDREYDQLLQLPPYSPEKISMPYMYLGSGRSNEYDSLYFFPSHIAAKEKYYVRLANAIHEDFSSLPSIAKRQQPSLKNVHAENYDTICRLTSVFFGQYLKGNKSDTVATYISRLEKTNPVQFSTRYPTRVPSAGR